MIDDTTRQTVADILDEIDIDVPFTDTDAGEYADDLDELAIDLGTVCVQDDNLWKPSNR